jgi:drug/metabolite transporter (DMT)-like permease
MPNKPVGFYNPLFQLGSSIVLTTIYELLLKIGATKTADIAGKSWAWTGLSGLFSGYVWVAIVFVILSLITWLYVLRYLPISVAFPISQVVHALIPLCSWLILEESITALRWCGIALVLVGLAVMARPAAELEERL